jgi:hypothetical protein
MSIILILDDEWSREYLNWIVSISIMSRWRVGSEIHKIELWYDEWSSEIHKIELRLYLIISQWLVTTIRRWTRLHVGTTWNRIMFIFSMRHCFVPPFDKHVRWAYLRPHMNTYLTTLPYLWPHMNIFTLLMTTYEHTFDDLHIFYDHTFHMKKLILVYTNQNKNSGTKFIMKI